MLPGKYYRFRSPKNIIEEIKKSKTKYLSDRFRYIYFADMTFGLHIGYLRKFTSLFVEEGLNNGLQWGC